MVDPGAPIADGPVHPDDLPEEEFLALMGRWDPPSPTAVADLFAAAPFRWWLVGGWALELAGGRRRPHQDTDVGVRRRDLPAVRVFLAGRGLHLWAPHPDRLRPILAGTTLDDDETQFWLRRDAASPWLVDLLATPTDGCDWLFSRDERVRRPLDDVLDEVDGIPILVPEVALLHKAGLDRERDRDDLDALRDVLDPAQRRWLADAIATAWPGHAWLDLL